MPRRPARPDHKDIGAGYIVLAILAGLIGGALSLLLRLPGPPPGWSFEATPGRAIALQHGPILVFFSAIPALIGGFGNWFVPPQIGARDTAFPRLAALALCLAMAGFVLTLGSLLLGASDPLLLLSIAVVVVALLLCAANLVATVLNLRVPGLRLADLPLLAWSQLIASLLIVSALPVLLGVLTVLLLHGAPAAPPLRHLFRLLGLPGFCIMILPAIGLVGEIVDRAGRRRPAHPAVVIAMAALAICGCLTWARPLLAGGLPGLDAAAPLPALAIILPLLAICGLWLRSLWRAPDARALLATTPGLYAAGFIVVLLGGGLDGLLTGAAFSPAQLHYVLSVGTLFALFAGFYDCIGPMTGRTCPPLLAKTQFWTLAAGVDLGVLPWPDLSALGAAFTGLSLLLFALVVVLTFAHRRVAPDSLPDPLSLPR